MRVANNVLLLGLTREHMTVPLVSNLGSLVLQDGMELLILGHLFSKDYTYEYFFFFFK